MGVLREELLDGRAVALAPMVPDGIGAALAALGARVEPMDGLVDGEDETPSPRASTVMTKYLAESTSLPGPISPVRSFVVPVNQVGNNTAFDFFAFSFPKVR